MLLQDLEGLIPGNDFIEIKLEQEKAYQAAFDRLYAEKILARTKGKPSTNQKKGNKKQPSRKDKPGKKNKPARKQQQQKKNKNDPRQPNKSAATKEGLIKQLQALTKAVSKLPK